MDSESSKERRKDSAAASHLGRAAELISDAAPQGNSACWSEKAGKATYELISHEKVDLSEALHDAGVTYEDWRVDSYTISSCDAGAKRPDGLVAKSTTYFLNANLTKRHGYSAETMRAKVIEEIKAASMASSDVSITQSIASPAHCMALLVLFDAHLGQLSWEGESGSRIDLEVSCARYTDAACDLLDRLQSFNCDKIVYVLGNDFLHVDGGANTTTKGTPQDADGKWQQSFLAGLKCARHTIDLARQNHSVDVLVVPGNHDEEKVWCLGQVLAANYDQCDDVSFWCGATPTKYYRFGTNLLGFVHGNELSEAKKTQLPSKMATDRPRDWAETTCREWFLGHLHREKETTITHRNSDTIGNVTIRECPALTGLDSWHNKKGYLSNPQAEAHIYDHDTGKIGYLIHNPNPTQRKDSEK